MNLRTIYKSVLTELNSSDIYWHGTSQWLPYNKFMSNMDGRGVVSSGGRKYGGFFFTSERKNAEFYGEFLLCKVKIANVKLAQSNVKSPTDLRKISIDRNEIYKVEDIFDGGAYSDIVFVPHKLLANINILGWELSCSEEDYIEHLNEKFSYYDVDEDGDETDDIIPPNQEYVKTIISQTGGGFDYLMKFIPFNKWFNTLEEG